jgi:hypothetical protein
VRDTHGIEKTSGKESETHRIAHAVSTALGRHQKVLAQESAIKKDTRYNKTLETRTAESLVNVIENGN